MQTNLTEKSLGIFWNGAEELDGIMVYGYFPMPNAEVAKPPLDLWKQYGESEKPWKLFGDDWTVWQWTIRIDTWPTKGEWLNLIRSTLENMHKQGAIVSWTGQEGGFADPPSLFSPEDYMNEIWALYSEPEGFLCNSELGKPYKAIDVSVLVRVREMLGFV